MQDSTKIRHVNFVNLQGTPNAVFYASRVPPHESVVALSQSGEVATCLKPEKKKSRIWPNHDDVYDDVKIQNFDSRLIKTL